MKQTVMTVLENTPLVQDVYRLRLGGDSSAITAPGQFIELQLKGCFLRRPLSVCDWDDDSVTVIYRRVGKGTALLSGMQKGEAIDVLSGLGNGFDASACGARPLLIGGGIGTPPLYGLARRLLCAGKRPKVLLGFNTHKEVFYEEEFTVLGVPTAVATADGSYGAQGLVTQALPDDFDSFYACGPLPMLRALCAATDKPGFLSLEARMGCGFGACMGCTVETAYGLKRVCKEGPVFRKEELIWQ